jgi:hypothetical protein
MSRQKNHEQRLWRLAKEIAASGRHISWFYVASELAEKGEPLAYSLLEKEPVRSELDLICEKARKAKWDAEPR